MDDHRKAELRRSLERELESHVPVASSEPWIRAIWLAEQLENYVERWLAFCALPAIPMPALLNDDLFAMIECGAAAFGDAIRRLPDESELQVRWSRFAALLADVRANADRARANELRGALAEVLLRLRARSRLASM